MSSIQKYSIIVVCFLALSMQSCKMQSQKESHHIDQRKRDSIGLCLGNMLEERNFERALTYIDSLHTVFPNDPQFYFVEGWIHDMQGDSLSARAAYANSLEIYDSLTEEAPDFSNMINRAMIVQILYGKEAYGKALDEMQSIFTSPQDTLEIEQLWRGYVFKKEDMSFGTNADLRDGSPIH